jgi:Transposase
MKRARFSEEQIIGVLKEVEAGAKVSESCAGGTDLGRDLIHLAQQVGDLGDAVAAPARGGEPAA